MNDGLIDLDVRLLLLRYGKRRVVEAMARAQDQSFEGMKREIDLAEAKKRARSKPKTPSLVELTESVSAQRPEIAEPLRLLSASFENRTFLPTLRDVQRFVGREGDVVAKFKSRAAAGPRVLSVLSKLPREDLARLVGSQRSDGESDYSRLARAIMRKPTETPER